MDLCTTEPAKLFDQTLPSCHVRQPTGRQPGGELAPGGQSFPQPVRILSPVFQIAIALHSPKRRLPPGVGVCRTATPQGAGADCRDGTCRSNGWSKRAVAKPLLGETGTTRIENAPDAV